MSDWAQRDPWWVWLIACLPALFCVAVLVGGIVLAGIYG